MKMDDKYYLRNIHRNASLLEGFLIKVLEKYVLKPCQLRHSWMGGWKRVKKVKNPRRISEAQDDHGKCKIFSYILSCKKPAGFSIIPSLQWLLKKKSCVVTLID
jgi:hypothetical protein